MFDKGNDGPEWANETEQLLRAQADSVPQILWTSDATGGILFANQRFREYTGLSQRDLQTELILTIIHPNDREGYSRSRADAIASGAEWERGFRIKRNDGAYRWHPARCAPNRAAAGDVTHWFGSATDIHDIHEARESLRQSQERLQIVLGASKIGAAVYDLSEQVVRADPQAHAVFGVPHAPETPLPTWTARIHPDDLPAFYDALGRFGRNEIHDYRLRYRVRGEDGNWRDVASHAVVTKRGADGTPVELTAVAQEISDREVEKRNALESQQRLMLAVEMARMGFAEYDIKAHTLKVSPTGLAMAGLVPTEPPLTPDQWFALVDPPDQARVTAAWASLLDGTADGVAVEYRLRRADNDQVIWISSRTTLIRDADGSPAWTLGVWFDRTEENRAQDLLQTQAREPREITDQRTIAFQAARIWDWDIATIAGSGPPSRNVCSGYRRTKTRATSGSWSSCTPTTARRFATPWTRWSLTRSGSTTRTNSASCAATAKRAGCTGEATSTATGTASRSA